MVRRWLVVLTTAVLLAGGTPLWADEDFVEVTVRGEGISKDAARKDALRKALEEGGRTEISSHSQAEDFVLVRDTIYARAEGIVTDYKVLKEGEGMNGTYLCEIRARVSKSAVASTWGEVQNVLDQIGRPGIMVLITEKIDGVVDNSSILESKIEERLLKSGFDVYAGEQVRAIAKKEADDAAADDNVAKMQAIAKDFGTQIFISGAANANAAGVRDLYGEPVAMYNGDCVVKMYYTDTGRLLASESLPQWRGGARGISMHSPQAGKQALFGAAETIVQQVYETVMGQWATQISAGGEIQIEVEGLSAGEAIKLKKKLEELAGIEKVNYKFTKGIASYRVVAKMNAEGLAEHLVEGEWAELLEIVDIKLNRIQAKKPAS